MKIIVANEQERELLKRFIDCLHDTGSFDDIENNDHLEGPEHCFLSSDEYRLISDNLYAGIVKIDETIEEMSFEDDSCVTGKCSKCGCQTEGTINGETVTYSDYLRYSSKERQENWLCETCYQKS